MTFHCWVFRNWVLRRWVFEAYCREYPTRNLELGISAAGYSRCWVFRKRTHCNPPYLHYTVYNMHGIHNTVYTIIWCILYTA